MIVGAPGAGKSTVGKAVADRLGVGFRDTDADIESGIGMSIADFFITEGEPAFRVLEKGAVAAAVAEHDGVLALGGGAVLDPATRELLAPQTVVWLQVGLADASARAGMSAARPLLLGNVRGTMLKLLNERTPLYESVATITVDTDGKPFDAVVDEVVAALQGSGHE